MDAVATQERPASDPDVRVLQHHNATLPQRRFWLDEHRFRGLAGGIGSGKTRAGAVEALRQPAGSIGCVVAPTYRMLEDATQRTLTDLVDRGEVLNRYDRGNNIYHLTNGSEIWFRTGDNPDRLRGPNLGWFWLDEAALMPVGVWNIMIGRLRLQPGRGWITTTPRGANWVYNLFADHPQADYSLVRSSTRDNIYLPAHFVRTLEDTYTSAFAAQEIEGEFLLDVEGALWTRKHLDAYRTRTAPDLTRIVVAVDPKASAEADSETGIVAAGLGSDGHGYVLGDRSIDSTPEVWAQAVSLAYDDFGADRVVAEGNQGGDMVRSVLRMVNPTLPVKMVHATRGKHTRAEPVAALYEQGRVHHVGTHTALENQMCGWVQGDKSPDRMDAMVWALTELMVKARPNREVRSFQG